jgi:hypothetical protein
MEPMKRLMLFAFLFCGLKLKLSAQAVDYLRPGLIRAHLTLTPARSLGTDDSHFYLHGALEGYLNSQLSLAGESYYYMGQLSSARIIFDQNHSIFFGANYHWVHNRSDLFVGFQPGFSITRLNAINNGLKQSETGFNPLVSIIAGHNFFIHSFFHFFVHSRLVVGEHHYNRNINLAELRISAGLGINLNSSKKK